MARCRRDSSEFFFLLLLGDRYGSRLLPDAIPTGSYERLMAQLDATGLALLAGAYQPDENAVPTAYVLRLRPSLRYGWAVSGLRVHAPINAG